MILSALTSVGYIEYYIVRCILVHGARVQKKAATFPLKGGREGRGKGMLKIFLQWNRDRAGLARRGATRGVGLIKRIDQNNGGN